MANNNKIFTSKESLKEAIKGHRETIGNMYGGYIESLYREQNNIGANVDLSNDKNFFKFREEYINTMAPFNIETVNSFIDFSDNATNIIKGRDYYKKKVLTTPVVDEKEKLAKMVDFFDVVSGKITDSGSGIHRVALTNAMEYQSTLVKGAESVQHANQIRSNLNSFLDPKGKIDNIVFYDLETLGGTNIHNQQELFGITEFTFDVLDKNKNKTQYSNVIGINKKQKQELENMLDRITGSQGAISNEDNVILDRLYKYGHGKSDLKNIAKGEWKAVLTDSNFTDEYDFDVVKKGIEKLYKIGKEQDIENNKTIAKPYQQLIEAVKSMTQKNTMVGGHNIQAADENWLNRSFMNAPSIVQNELKKVLGPNMKLDIDPAKQIDTLRIANLYSAIENKNDLYSSEVMGQLKENGLSTLKQESLIRQYFPEIFGSGAAHAAEKDVEGSALLVLGNDKVNSPVQMMLDKINSHFNDKNSPVFNNSIVGNRQELFVNDNTVFMDDFFKKGGLSFTKDKLSGEYITFGGKALDGNGNVYNGVKQSLKKNMTYTIGSKGRVDLEANSEMSKAIQSLYPEYNQGELFFAEFMPVYNSNLKGATEHSALHSPTYLVSTSEKDLQDTINGMTLIGKANDKYDFAERVMHTDGYEYINNKTIQDKIQSKYRQYTIKDKSITPYKEASIENIITEGTSQVMRDSAARQVRKDSYTTAVAFDNFLNEISKKTGIEKGKITYDDVKETVQHALKVSEEVVRNKKHDIMALNEQSANASKAVLGAMRGEAIKAGAVPIDAIFSYNYMGQQIPYSNTINNVISNFDYFAAQNKLSQIVIDEINRANPDGNMSHQQKEFMYQHLLNETKSKLASSKTGQEEVQKSIMSNSEIAPMYGKDINFFELNLGDNFFQKRNKGIHQIKNKADDIAEDNILKVNLDKKGGGLISSLLNKNYSNLKGSNREEMATYQLARLSEYLKGHSEYSSYFEDFNINLGGDAKDLKTLSFINRSKYNERVKALSKNPTKKQLQKIEQETRVNGFNMPAFSLAEEVIYRLKDVRKNNPGAGYESSVYRQNTLTDNVYSTLGKLLGTNEEYSNKVKGFVADAAKNMPSLTTVDSFNARKFVQSNLIEEGLRTDFTDATKLIKKYGYSEDRAKQLVGLYNKTEESLTNIVSDYVSEMSKINVDFVWNSKNKKAGLIHNGQGVVIDNMPKIKSYNGSMYIQVGRNEISLNSVLTHKDGSFKIETSLDKAYKNMMGNFKSFAKNGVETDNRLMSGLSAIQNFVKEVRNGSSVDRHDLIDRQSNFVLDYSELISNLHNMYESGKFYDSPAMQKEVVSLLQKEGVSANKIFAGDKELFGDAIYDIFDVVKRYGDKDVKEFLKQNTHALKDVQVSEQKSVFGGLPVSPWWQLVNQQRPPLNQIPRAVTMRESEWDEGFKQLKKSGVIKSPLEKRLQRDSYIHNNETLKAYRSYDEVNKTYTNIGFNALQLNTSEIQMKALLNSDYNKKLDKRNKLKNQQLEKIHDVLMTTNLYEQEEIVDARIASTVFHKMDYQKVSAKKDIILELNSAKDTQKQMEELKGKILPKFTIHNGELKVTIQKEGKLVKRFDPIINTVGFGDSIQFYGSKDDIGTLKFGFFRKDGLLATEKELNTTVKKHGLDLSNGINSELTSKLYDLLGDKFDAAFYVENGLDNGYFKLGHSMSEKSMAFAPMFGFGQYNKRLSKSIDKLRDVEIQKGSGITFGNLENKVLRDNLLDVTAKALVENGAYGNINEAKNVLLREKYAPSQYLFDEVLKSAEGINGEKIFSIANHAIKKHENVNIPIESMTNMLIDSIKSEVGNDMNKVLNYSHDGASLKDAFKLGSGIDIKDNKIVFKDSIVKGGDINNYVDLNVLEKLAKGRNLTWKDSEGAEHLGLAYQQDGVTFGTITKQYMNKVNDYDKISSYNYDSVRKQLDEAKRKYGPDSIEYQEAANKIQERAAVQRAIQRGTKITDREVMMMNWKKADTAFDFLQGNLNEKEFIKSAGHLIKKDESGTYLKDKNGQYLMDKQATNESLMGYFTNQIKEDLFVSQKDIEEGKSLHDAMKYNQEAYSHLSGIAKEFNNGKGISTKKAEEMYSLSQGFKAMDFNAGNLGMEDIVKGGFNSPVSIEKLSLAMGGDASYNLSNPNSFYNKSMVVDLGFGKQIGENNRYLAIPQMPVRQNGEEIAKYEFQSDMNRLFKARQNVIDSLEGKQAGKANENYDKALQKYINLIDKTKEDLSKNVTAKYGLLHSAVSVKMDKSISGKASAIALGTTQDLENITDKSLKNFIKDTNKSLREKNVATVNNALTKAMYKGESLADIYKQGKFVDAKFMGVEAFERLGYFNKDYMKKVGVESKEEMKKLLMTKGTMGVTGRYPTIYAESFKPTMMYLNDKLHGMRMQLTAEGQLSAAGDNDGDITTSYILQAGKEKYDYLAAQMHRDGMMNKEVEARFKKDYNKVEERAFKNAETLIDFNATGVNKFYHSKIMDQLGKDMKDALNNDMLTVTGSKKLDNRVYAAFGLGAGSAEDFKKHKATYDEIEKQILGNLGASSRGEVKSDEFLKEADNIIGAMNSEAQAEKYKKAIVFNESWLADKKAMMAKSKKSSIGAANIPLFNLRKASNLFIEGNDSERALKQDIIQHFSTMIEQDVISTKKATALQNVQRTNQFVTSFNKLIYDGNKEHARTWLKDISDSEFEAISKKMGNNMSREQLTEKFLSTVSSFSSNNKEAMNALRQSNRLAQGVYGVAQGNIQKALNGLPTTNDTMLTTYINRMRNAGLYAGEGLSEERLKATASNVKKREKLRLIDGRELLEEESNTASKEIKEILSGTQKVFSKAAGKVSGKGLAIGALGIAGSFLMAGFVGGNPSAPAQNQAADQAGLNENNNASDFANAQQSQASNTQQQGYVININASSPQGKKHAMEAIQNAVSQSVPTDVNISMNINNGGGNISDRDIEKILTGAF